MEKISANVSMKQERVTKILSQIVRMCYPCSESSATPCDFLAPYNNIC